MHNDLSAKRGIPSCTADHSTSTATPRLPHDIVLPGMPTQGNNQTDCCRAGCSLAALHAP